MTRVVVSGVGVISSVGITLDDYWSHLKSGTGAFVEAKATPGTGIVVGEVRDTSHAEGLPLPSLAPCDRSGVFAVAAAVRALEDAGFRLPFENPDRVAIVLGNGAGGQTSIDDQYHRTLGEQKRTHPLSVVRSMVSASASWVSIATGARGPCFVTSSACASSSHAIGVAMSLIRSGVADVVITGGTEACLSWGTLLAWDAMKVMSRTVCRPFALGRDGLMISEGAGALILESEEHARARGLRDGIELAGFAANADAGDILAPSTEGMTRVMRRALVDAGMTPGDVDYVNAHGTATRANDLGETEAVKQVFGASSPAMSSTKAVTGHALGAAGALEAVATVLAMRHSIAPPTANFDAPDPGCDIDCVPNIARPMRIDAALSNSFAFGGLNATLAFRRYQ